MANWVDLDTLSADTLWHLAALRRDKRRWRYTDAEAFAEELAVMLNEGRKPTIGWYRKHQRQPEPDSDQTTNPKGLRVVVGDHHTLGGVSLS